MKLDHQNWQNCQTVWWSTASGCERVQELKELAIDQWAKSKANPGFMINKINYRGGRLYGALANVEHYGLAHTIFYNLNAHQTKRGRVQRFLIHTHHTISNSLWVASKRFKIIKIKQIWILQEQGRRWAETGFVEGESHTVNCCALMTRNLRWIDNCRLLDEGKGTASSWPRL